MKLELATCLILAVATLAQNSPLRDPQICGRPECKGSEKFKYTPGVQYNYKYSVNISTLFEGTSKNVSNLQIQTLAHFDFISYCEGLLHVTDVKLRDPDDPGASSREYVSGEDGDSNEEDEGLHRNSLIFAEALNRFPLRFAFQDGLITEVCPSEEEPNWALNFKKGILSMMHNTMRRFDLDHVEEDEEDVHGKCRTMYWVEGPKETSLIIEKKKEDLEMCEQRSTLHSTVQSTSYGFKRMMHPGKTLIKSSSNCRLSVDHRVYNDITCEEKHVFEPFSNSNSGATTKINQRLTLVEEITTVIDDQPDVERRTPLLFDHVPSMKPTSGELKISRDIIKKLCKLSSDDVQTEFSELFTRFIHTSRVLSYTALSVLYDHSRTLCPTGKKHVLDALPYLGSGAAVSLMKDVILKRSVSETTTNEWMLAIALIPRPDISMLEAGLVLLNEYDSAPVILGVSSMVYTYCKQNSECREIESVDGTIQLLEDRVIATYESGQTDRSSQETLIVALKALSNIGTAYEDFKERLATIIEDQYLDVNIRVSAIEVHRRYPCEEARTYFEGLFRNESINSQVRIASYLQVMRCPNYLVIRSIKHALETENVNQVGSFVWSHLHNLLKSSIPSRVEIQGLLSDKDLGKKFNTDMRKYSHNYEGSMFFEEYNAGGSYESNVIFSTDSFIPRSAILNLTVDIFGESINLLEVYGQIEGFEHYVEAMFGPKGPYSAKKVQEKLPKFRWGRAAREDDQLKNQIEAFDYKLNNKFGSPKVGLGMKLFGNELKYVTYEGDEEIQRALKTLNLVDHLKRILSGKEINYNKAAMFLDTSYVVASGAGFPVTLNAVGTSSINMQLKGSLVANNFIENREMDLTGKISPNMAIDVVGTMSVDVYYASTAIKIKSSMYTSSSIEGKIKVRGSKLISLKFGIPKKTVEIFGAKSELVVKRGSLEEVQAGISNLLVSESSCSWPTVDKTIGLKICADYHFTNVTEKKDAQFFLLAGPAGFRVSLQKSDPTATTYLLEYKWEEFPSNTQISLTFDTPGSTIRRLLVGNLTIDRESQNINLLLQSSEGELLARGKYRNTEMEKYLELGLDINNQKKFDVLLSLQKKPIRNGFLFEPKFFLGINGARVAELQGTSKLIMKSGISQYDVDLKFETKRLTSKLFGYISKTGSSLSSTLRLHYKFKDTNEHAIHLDFSLANRTTRNIFILNGDARVQTTAYPNYNFNATASLQHSGGHLETKLIINASPHLRKNLQDDPEMLIAQLFFTYRGLSNSTRFKAFASAKRPSTNLDVKAQVSYDLYGYSTNSIALLRYGKGKDIIVTLYWNHPKLTQENFEGRLNVTIPGFSPMILDGKLKEKNQGDYMIEFSCAWFSGHMIDVKGLYQDKSTASASNHHLKLVIKSPSFEEINGDGYYYRNNTEFRIDVKADQSEDEYGLYLKHVRTSPYEISSMGRVKYKAQLYSISSMISLKEKHEISVELHIDQIRDIFLSLWAHDKLEYKEAGCELKWDANRDPNQKLAASVYYSNPEPYNYESHFYISYPGRTIKGLFVFLLEDAHFNTLANLAWEPEEVLSIRFTTDYRLDQEIFVQIEAELLTPFDEWRKTAFNGGFENKENMYRTRCSVYWQKDQVSVDLFGDYAVTPSEFKCEFASTLNSTVDDIPSLSASVKHCHNSTKVDSELFIVYQPKQKIAVTSSWQIDEDPHTKNLTGTVTLVSPFRGFNKGLLVSKIYVTSSRSIRGEANLDLDHKEYTASVSGYFKKISKCMFTFNVTTPMEKFKLINGRFGFLEEQRHLVAHVTYPSGKTGVEIRLFVASLTHFDIKFNVATPFELLQEILIVAKLTPNAVEFIAGWNTINFGVSGVWYQNKITDFEYSCKIYTPLQGLEENGAVAKLIMKEGLDFEISVKLADNQLGVIIIGKPKPKTLQELGIKTQELYNKLIDDESPYYEKSVVDIENSDTEDEDDEEDEEEEENPFRWTGHIRVDTLMYPTITGDVDIDQKGTVFDVVATLALPEGTAELRNEFDFRDAFTMKNRLRATTPYQQFKLITSNYDLKVSMENQYLLALDLNYLNGSRWIKTGCLAHYLHRSYRNNQKLYNVTLDVHTPWDQLPLLKLKASLNKNDILYNSHFALLTNETDILITADMESELNRTDGHAVTHMKTPIFVIPKSVITFKKHYLDYENRIEFGFKMENNTNRVKLDTSWRFISLKDVMMQIYLITPFKGMERVEGGVGVHAVDDTTVARANILIHPIDAKLNATIKNNNLTANMILDFNGKRQIFDLESVITNLDGANSKMTGVLGVLSVNSKRHDVVASLEYKEDIPVGVNMEIKPQDGGTPIIVHYELNKQEGNAVITTTMKQGMKFVRLRANVNSRSISDWNMRSQIETSHQIYKLFIVNTNVMLTDFNKTVTLDAKTPFERIEKIQAGGTYTALGTERKANAFYVLGDSGGSFRTTWAWLILENMGLNLIGNYYNPNYRHDIGINAHYVNPKKSFKMLNVGAGIDINNDWVIGSNLTVSKPARNHVDIEATILLPKPTDELHTFSGNFKGSRDLSNIKYLAKYKTLNSKLNYGSSGNILYANKTHIIGDVKFEWDTKFLHNFVKLNEADNIHYFLYKLRSPKFAQEALITNISYTNWNDYYNITGELFYPGNRSVGSGHLNFKEFSNMNGFVNASTPFPNMTHAGGKFLMETNRLVKNSYVQLFWPGNDAFIDSKCLVTEIDGSAIDRHTKGTILVEVPVTTRHVVFADYTYTEKSSVSKGEAKVEYNKDVILEGSYNCLSESQAGHDKDSIHVELENKFVPMGADYVHQTKYSGENYKIIDFKHIRVYHLHNQTIFDVTGDMNIENRETGQTITLKALHSNRTVKLMTTYDILDMELKQNSRIELGPNIWLAYDLDIVNKTMSSAEEAQDVQINLSYPKRNFTCLGSYLITNKSISSDLKLNWGKDNTEMTRTIQGSLEWRSHDHLPHRKEILLEIMHPSFEKNVMFLGEYDRTERTLADLNLTIDYSNNPDQTLKLCGTLQDNSNNSLLNYTYTLYGTHPDTSLQLDVKGGINYRPRWFYSYHLVDYKRTYLPLQNGEATTRIDLDQYEIELKRKTLHELSYLWSKYAGKYPLYTANVSAIHGKDLNATGEFYLNFKEKDIQLELNMTSDGSQSVHMKGFIPDARSAYFDLWREYDIDRISDISYFLRMNHSRLIVASLLWRPDLKQDIKDAIKEISVGMYNHTVESTEYWRQYIRAEVADAISDIWQDANPMIEGFLDDIKDLKMIEEDLQDLKVFLNESYNANEFYIKDLVYFIEFIVDELSIRSHIESVPSIINEIWEVMGESGKKIQKGIAWVVEKIKMYYKNAAEFINGLFQGDSLEHLSEGLKDLVAKYDNFIKDLHVSFIRYMEQLWKQFYKMLNDNWHKTLATIEPTFIKFIHYLETIVWNASKEVLDFLYIRKTEIIENPYFNRISNFTHDLDHFYKDMTGNDTIGSIYKYSKKVWVFLKEKYFKLVPFGKELQEIVNEILNEIYELKNLPSVRLLTEKYKEMEEKVRRVCDYFDLENRIHRVITLVHMKFVSTKLTALEAENRYREAKTKFVFEPEAGKMHLEQKLPMSWHAFNETPNFDEIPEYKALTGIPNYFSMSKMTFSNFYYNYKPFTDPTDWLPPFKAQAMLVGLEYFVTFDREIYKFQGDCTYLLAADFLDRNFSIALSYNKQNAKSHELIILVHHKFIYIDVFQNVVKLENNTVATLPFEIEDVFVYQEADILTVKSEMGFQLKCNLKFHLCIFEVTGWYFGKTAGLWGTFNNEHCDDLSAANRTLIDDNLTFAGTWAVESKCADAKNTSNPSKNPSIEVAEMCESLFASSISQFSSCFDRIPIDGFLNMCLDSVSEEQACTSVLAYMKACSHANTPLRIPDTCVKCNLVNGSVVPEGAFVSMEKNALPKSADIVFIVEVKECNKDLRARKNLDEIIENIEKELLEIGMLDNRYSMVTFGGDGVHSKPRSVVVNGEIFTHRHTFPSYMDKIVIGNGSQDIYESISFATKLVYRPGVSKVFVLLPCSDCKEYYMKFDYTVLHQLLLESDISLHILMNDEFQLKKARANKNKIPFGVDRSLAYTKKDADGLVGDELLKKSIQLPKSSLGYCTPLALETNGSIFSSKKLETEKTKTMKKIAAVFAKRVAKSASLNTCKACECTAHNSGVSYMECFPCVYPTPIAIDYGFDEDEMLSVMQPSEDGLYDYDD